MGKQLFPLLLLLSLVMLVGYNSAMAQIPGMRKYSLQDGFTATNSYHISQDERGYLWIGTDNGGMLFDGKKFTELQQVHHADNSDILRCVNLDKGVMLLVPTIGAVHYLYRCTSARQSFIHKNFYLRTTKHNLVRFDAITNSYWISDSYSPEHLYHFQGKHVAYFSGGSGYMLNCVGGKFIGVDHRGIICAYDPVKKDVQLLYREDGTKILGITENLVQLDDQSFILTFTPKGKQVHIYEYKAGDSILKLSGTIQLPAQTSGVNAAQIGNDRQLWLTLSGKGEVGYCGDIRKIQKGHSIVYTIAPGNINSLFIDRGNNIWLSSPDNALYFLSADHFKNALAAKRFARGTEKLQHILGNDRGQFYLGYANSNSLFYVHDKVHELTRLDNVFKSGFRIFPLTKDKYIIAGGDLARLNLNNNVVTGLNAPHNSYKDVCLYKNNDLLAASSGGVIYAASALTGTPVYELIYEGRALAIDVVANDRILIGTPDGLYSKEHLRSPATKVRNALLNRNHITDILSLSDGSALIGTYEKGLYRYCSDDSIKKINSEENHIPARVRKLYRQHDDTYWAATDKGAWCITFDRDWNIIKTRGYTLYDGLPSNNVTDIYVSGDTAFITTTEGLGIIPIKERDHFRIPRPAIYINSVQTDKKTTYNPDSTLKLLRYENNFKITLSAISYESLGNVHFYYRLFPFQADWIETTDPEIRFNLVSPGSYTFQAYATNAKGIKSDRTISLDIKVQPAFWETYLFKICLIILFGTLLYLLVNWRIRKNERIKHVKIQQRRHLAELELEAIKAQINPHFIYNCLNSFQYLNYKKKYDEAQDYLNIFGRLLRMTMEYAQRPFISIAEEAKYLADYLHLEKLRFKEELQYEIDIEDTLRQDTLIPAMLLQPYVENAIKHGIAKNELGGKVLVRFTEHEGCIVIIISDNGPGFRGPVTLENLGLRLSKTRIRSYNELFNLDIRQECYNAQDHDPNAHGAIVKITIHTSDHGNVTNKSSNNR